jgi:Mn-dependent DtxR family transcriptional regulator
MNELKSENRTYFTVIPFDVMYDKELPPNAKLLYGEISALTYQRGYCFATNTRLAQAFDVTPQAISKWINLLAEKGYLKLEYLYNGKEVKERHIYIQETAHKMIVNSSNNVNDEVSTNIYTSSDEVSIKDEQGINKRLKGYQQKIKESNTDIVIHNSNTYSENKSEEPILSVDEELDSANKKSSNKRSSKKSEQTFSEKDYSDCMSLYYKNREELSKVQVVTNAVYSVKVCKKRLRQFFLQYGVEDTKKGIINSMKHSWVKKTDYSIYTVLAPTMFDEYIAGSTGVSNYSQNKPEQYTDEQYRADSDDLSVVGY